MSFKVTPQQPKIKTVKLYVKTVSGCTGRHYTPITREVSINSSLQDGDIVDKIEVNDNPLYF